jgi:hypothetical protein
MIQAPGLDNCNKQSYQGAQNLTGENLKVVPAEFSALS